MTTPRFVNTTEALLVAHEEAIRAFWREIDARPAAGAPGWRMAWDAHNLTYESALDAMVAAQVEGHAR